ncbi:MAG: DUF3822 family protein, partial [Chitinophagaceae bacterium]|nr:DUF3822 family protein [Chitinophagaceae bacterium]
EEIVAGDELLGKNIPVSAIIYNMPESHLVPALFFNEEMNKDLLAIVHGDLRKDVVLWERILNLDMYNIYLIPGDIHRFLDRKFSPAQYKHFYSLWMVLWQEQEHATETIEVIFYPNELLVMLCRNNSIELVQTYAYETAEDVSYHVLNIYNRYNLSPLATPLKVSGMIATDSFMYEELLKYFMLVEIVSPPKKLELLPELDSFPAHFFAPILKLTTCVL